MKLGKGMFGYVCIAMHAWPCIYSYACMAMYVYPCSYGIQILKQNITNDAPFGLRSTFFHCVGVYRPFTNTWQSIIHLINQRRNLNCPKIF